MPRKAAWKLSLISWLKDVQTWIINSDGIHCNTDVLTGLFQKATQWPSNITQLLLLPLLLGKEFCSLQLAGELCKIYTALVGMSSPFTSCGERERKAAMSFEHWKAFSLKICVWKTLYPGKFRYSLHFGIWVTVSGGLCVFFCSRNSRTAAPRASFPLFVF